MTNELKTPAAQPAAFKADLRPDQNAYPVPSLPYPPLHGDPALGLVQYTAMDMRAAIDADRAMRAQPAPAAVAIPDGHLYAALNDLLTHIGMEGVVTADHPFVLDTMAALKRIDGGVYLDNLAIPTEPDAYRADMLATVILLEDGEWTEHHAKTPLGMRLEDAITKLHNELHAASASGGAAPAAVAGPSGWKLVPVEPTEDMKAAAVKYTNGAAVYKNVAAEALRIEEGIYGEVYGAMLAAAPLPPAPAAVAVPSETVKFSDQSAADPIEKTRRYLKHIADKRPNNPYFFDDGFPRECIADDAAAALAVFEQLAAAPQPPAAAQEPVAWLHTNRLGGVQAFTNEPPPGLKEQCQPLYTHPAPQQAAQGEFDADDMQQQWDTAFQAGKLAAAPIGHTDGGRNMFYEGRFEGESEREQKARLAWADDMRAAFERHTGNGWFDKDWHRETALWAAAWRACQQPAPAAQGDAEAIKALARIESALDWHLGRSAFTQTRNLKGFGHSERVREELYAAHDEVRAVLAARAQAKEGGAA